MAILHYRQLPLLSCPFLTPKLPSPSSSSLSLHILCASKRTGKQRYPSEKKKLKLQHKKALSPVDNKFQGIWRLSKLAVSVQDDPGKDFLAVSDALLQQIAKAIEFPVPSMLPPEAFTIVRKSFDARKMLKEPRFVYTVDMDPSKLISLEPRTREFISDLEPKVGVVEYKPQEDVSGDLLSLIHGSLKVEEQIPAEGHQYNTHLSSMDTYKYSTIRKPKIAIVGSGPSGLFASLVLAELGVDVTLMERGQPVEQRGRDIGALMVRRILELESNFCFGEVIS